MTKESSINILEDELKFQSDLDPRDRLPDKVLTAIQFSIDSLKKGSKSWKGYRRFKTKYVNLKRALDLYYSELKKDGSKQEIARFKKFFETKEDDTNG